MTTKPTKRVRCAVYTRVSTEYGLAQEFNSLDAQHEAAEAYIRSQAHDGWTLIRTRYDDGGYSGGSTERPALQRLLADIRDHRIDIVVVYKVDRLTRSLADFAKLVELFDAHSVSFVSVTQQFNTTTSMGRLTLNVLLSFAQFEREVTSERIRDETVPDLDLVLPHDAAGLDGGAHNIAAQSSAAWEAASTGRRVRNEEFGLVITRLDTKGAPGLILRVALATGLLSAGSVGRCADYSSV